MFRVCVTATFNYIRALTNSNKSQIIFFWWLIWPLTRYTIELGLKIYGAILYFVLWMLVQGTTISVDVISKLSGGVSGLAVAKIQGVGPLLLDEARIQKTYETELDLDFISYRDMVFTQLAIKWGSIR